MFIVASEGRKSIKDPSKSYLKAILSEEAKNNTQKCPKKCPTWLQNRPKLGPCWAPTPSWTRPRAHKKGHPRRHRKKHPKREKKKSAGPRVPANGEPFPPPDLLPFKLPQCNKTSSTAGALPVIRRPLRGLQAVRRM